MRQYLYGARLMIPDYEHKPIKVGITGNPQQRYKGFLGGLPFPIQWLGIWPAKKGRQAEQAVFDKFADYRLGGEWFHPVPELLAFIEENVTRYAQLIEKYKEEGKTPTRRIPKNVEGWIGLAEYNAYKDFNEHYGRVLKFAGRFCFRCKAEIKEPHVSDGRIESAKERISLLPKYPVLDEARAAELMGIPVKELTSARKDGKISHLAISKTTVRYRQKDLIGFLDSHWARDILREADGQQIR